MIKIRQPHILILLLTLTITACTKPAVNEKIEKEGQYWQRISTSSSLYLRGPKAQQMLNRDIARCVTELRELERLGAVKDAIPEYAEDIVMSREEAKLAGHDTPERDKELFAEHSDYIDFEGCMIAKGWERIKYVPFDTVRQADQNYLNTHVAHRPQKTDKKKKPKKRGDYDHLND